MLRSGFLTISLLLTMTAQASAFCGFYVAKGDAKLFNKASKVIVARHLDRTVITMANDYQGEPSEFAMVIPTPTVLERGQINVAEPAVIDHIDAFTAPRLVEYFDENPCMQRRMRAMSMQTRVQDEAEGASRSAKSLGVTVEAEYTVGEYDIQILSAKESGGLATWLTQNGYTLPDGAEPVLADYVGAGMKFFVAKINLEEKARTGLNYLRPLQIAFNSPDFMLPIRLGTLNADGMQELFVFTVTRQGRVEGENYRTVKMPTDAELPVFIRSKFPEVYRSLFAEQVRREPGVMFLEYAWNMNWCDPCAADPLSRDELRTLGAWWVQPDLTQKPIQVPQPGPTPRPLPAPVQRFAPQQPVEAFVTRLHLRYDSTTHPRDLMFRETQDQSNYQARYVIRHPWTGEVQCPEAEYYKQQLPARQDARAQRLASLTAWPIGEIRQQMSLPAQGPGDKWWESIWNK
ncbi:DUF2330 domain-containing protein [Minwuia sp.]|uniref:DUF2330 domain-containing protein n=1 Tax=Minwuia sp. TaxID=2493630 RepID=UPI003A90B089